MRLRSYGAAYHGSCVAGSVDRVNDAGFVEPVVGGFHPLQLRHESNVLLSYGWLVSAEGCIVTFLPCDSGWVVARMGGMSHLEVPRFPRGFLLAEHSVHPPPGYLPGPLLENFYVHPWTHVECAGNTDLFVIVIGHLVPTTPGQGNDPAQCLLTALRDSETQFLAALSEYSGRHAVIFGSLGNIRVVNDATAMRSVFYASDGGVIASHALLVEQALGGEIRVDDLVYRYGYPGNRTPYVRTKLLSANTYYWLTANVVKRFWPLVAPPERDVESVAAEALDAATVAFRNMSAGRKVKMALTAGLDSRTILAVGLRSGVPFDTYTYGIGADTARDQAFAKDLAAHVGVEHTSVPHVELTEELRYSLDEAHYLQHHQGVVNALAHFFGDPTTLAVSGNLLEIGRSFYAIHKRNGADAPVSAETMTGLYYRAISGKTKREIKEYGFDRFMSVSERAFGGFIADTGFDIVQNLVNPFDLFYWEHRMSAWHGPAMVERDFYGVAFIPFNSRRIFEAMLGVAQEQRDESAVFYRMIEMVDRGLLELPVNPKQWPQ